MIYVVNRRISSYPKLSSLLIISHLQAVQDLSVSLILHEISMVQISISPFLIQCAQFSDYPPAFPTKMPKMKSRKSHSIEANTYFANRVSRTFTCPMSCVVLHKESALKMRHLSVFLASTKTGHWIKNTIKNTLHLPHLTTSFIFLQPCGCLFLPVPSLRHY